MNIYKAEEIEAFLQRFQSRRSQVSREITESVERILADVRERGDAALIEYSARFDGVDLKPGDFEIGPEIAKRAHQSIPADLLDALRQAKDNIARFHRKALPQSWFSWEANGAVLGQRYTPLERVGIYVPGGRAPYPSSLLMGAIPAQVAGVKEIVITTPCGSGGEVNPTILAAAVELGIDKIYRLGGAHAVAAMAYGTASVPRVDKIVGPGNIYVATAKKLLYGQCGIDMVAGPSEVIVIADDSAEPAFIAADLLAQAEHDPLASSILITTSAELVRAVEGEIAVQLPRLSRRQIAAESLEQYGGLLIAESLDECCRISNLLAPEHLGLHVREPWNAISRITHAGAIFLGSYSPEAVGDYWAGPNHILPTDGSARFFSPLRSEDFLKASSVIAYTREALGAHSEQIVRFALSEGLEAHALSIRVRGD